MLDTYCPVLASCVFPNVISRVGPVCRRDAAGLILSDIIGGSPFPQHDVPQSVRFRDVMDLSVHY